MKTSTKGPHVFIPPQYHEVLSWAESLNILTKEIKSSPSWDNPLNVKLDYHLILFQNEKNQIMKSNVWLRLVSLNKIST